MAASTAADRAAALWQRRWFVLDGAVLRYHKSSKDPGRGAPALGGEDRALTGVVEEELLTPALMALVAGAVLDEALQRLL